MDDIDNFIEFLNELPDIDSYRYMDGEEHVITQEWLCGAFAGRAFVADTEREAIVLLKQYLDRHIGHDSMVGRAVTTSGWPNLNKVKEYLNRRSAHADNIGVDIDAKPCIINR